MSNVLEREYITDIVKWEYMSYEFYFRAHNYPYKISTKLNSLGNDGWKVESYHLEGCNTSEDSCIVFDLKRTRAEEP